MKKRPIIGAAAFILLGSIAMPFLLRWAMPMLCMCTLISQHNAPGDAEARIREHFGPLIIHTEILRERCSDPDQESLYHDWKGVETVYRFRTIVIVQWIIICALVVQIC